LGAVKRLSTNAVSNASNRLIYKKQDIKAQRSRHFDSEHVTLMCALIQGMTTPCPSIYTREVSMQFSALPGSQQSFAAANASDTRSLDRRFSFKNNAARNQSAGRTFDAAKIEAGVKLILEGIGEDASREGLEETPARVARMFEELVYGTDIDPATEITSTFQESTDELILVRDIPFASICEHHLVPFLGVAHIGYIPRDGVITGLSKLARIVELASKRLQVQERLTTQIADALMKKLNPQGVVVVLEAEHLCMSIRGINKPGSKTITSALRGIVKTHPSTRAEVMSLINCR
jgi:GTP cyclohydrolase I